MTNVETLYRIWVYLQTEPLFWLTITIGAFLVGDYLYKKSNINPLVNPIAISILIVSGILLTFGIEYERYCHRCGRGPPRVQGRTDGIASDSSTSLSMRPAITPSRTQSSAFHQSS